MNNIREFLNRSPWLGWLLAILLLLGGAFMYWRMRPGSAPYSQAQMTQNVTIRCTETGKEWTMPRGRMEQELFARAGALDAGVGLTNPDTGRPTGFPVDDWKSTVERINEAKRALASGGRGGGRAPGGSQK